MKVILWLITNSGLIKNVLLATASIVGSSVAVMGLTTWKKQIKSRTDYELAKALLIDVYELREAIDSVRNPFMIGEEQAAPDEDLKSAKSPKHEQAIRIAYAYQKRWESVGAVTAHMSARMNEAEVLWGPEVRQQFALLILVVNELWVTLRMYFDDIREEREYKLSEKDLKKRNSIIYGVGDLSSDNYRKRLTEQIEKFESLVRPKLQL